MIGSYSTSETVDYVVSKREVNIDAFLNRQWSVSWYGGVSTA